MTAIAAVFLAASSAQATVATVSSATLASNAGHYLNLDGAGLNLDVTYTGGGSLQTIAGGGPFEGLWFGGSQGSGLYTLTFSKPVDYFSMHVNAMSTFGSYVETIGQFAINAAGTPSFSFTNTQYTAWDGSTVTAGPLDNGDFNLAITAAGGAAFSTVSFYHAQKGGPNGSVLRNLGFESYGGGGVIGDGGTGGGVPEPATWALMITGFGMAGMALRRRSSAVRAA
jgi:hypothetical protein